MGIGMAINRYRRILLEVVVSSASALPVLGLVAVVTRTPEGNSTGFPLTWSSPVTPCPEPNPFNGCGFSYSLPVVLVDYAVWVVVILTLLVVGGLLLRGRPPGRANVDPRPGQR